MTVFFLFFLGVAPAEPIQVLLCHSMGGSQNDKLWRNVLAQLNDTGVFSSVTAMNCGLTTPSLDMLLVIPVDTLLLFFFFFAVSLYLR